MLGATPKHGAKHTWRHETPKNTLGYERYEQVRQGTGGHKRKHRRRSTAEPSHGPVCWSRWVITVEKPPGALGGSITWRKR